MSKHEWGTAPCERCGKENVTLHPAARKGHQGSKKCRAAFAAAQGQEPEQVTKPATVDQPQVATPAKAEATQAVPQAEKPAPAVNKAKLTPEQVRLAQLIARATQVQARKARERAEAPAIGVGMARSQDPLKQMEKRVDDLGIMPEGYHKFWGFFPKVDHHAHAGKIPLILDGNFIKVGPMVLMASNDAEREERRTATEQESRDAWQSESAQAKASVADLEQNEMLRSRKGKPPQRVAVGE